MPAPSTVTLGSADAAPTLESEMAARFRWPQRDAAHRPTAQQQQQQQQRGAAPTTALGATWRSEGAQRAAQAAKAHAEAAHGGDKAAQKRYHTGTHFLLGSADTSDRMLSTMHAGQRETEHLDIRPAANMRPKPNARGTVPVNDEAAQKPTETSLYRASFRGNQNSQANRAVKQNNARSGIRVDDFSTPGEFKRTAASTTVYRENFVRRERSIDDIVAAKQMRIDQARLGRKSNYVAGTHHDAAMRSTLHATFRDPRSHIAAASTPAKHDRHAPSKGTFSDPHERDGRTFETQYSVTFNSPDVKLPL